MQQNAGLLVLVAHSGKQIHLDVQPTTRYGTTHFVFSLVMLSKPAAASVTVLT